MLTVSKTETNIKVCYKGRVIFRLTFSAASMLTSEISDAKPILRDLHGEQALRHFGPRIDTAEKQGPENFLAKAFVTHFSAFRYEAFDRKGLCTLIGRVLDLNSGQSVPFYILSPRGLEVREKVLRLLKDVSIQPQQSARRLSTSEAKVIGGMMRGSKTYAIVQGSAEPVLGHWAPVGGRMVAQSMVRRELLEVGISGISLSDGSSIRFDENCHPMVVYRPTVLASLLLEDEQRG